VGFLLNIHIYLSALGLNILYDEATVSVNWHMIDALETCYKHDNCRSLQFEYVYLTH